MFKGKTIIFDYDGTICNTREAAVVSLKNAYEKFNIPQPDSSNVDIAIYRGLTMYDAITFLQSENGGVDAAKVMEMVTEYRRFYDTEGYKLVELFDGIPELLQQLKSDGYSLVIGSNKSIDAVAASLKYFGIEEFIDFIAADGVLTSDSLKMKPDAMLYTDFIVPRSGEACINGALMIGDTVTDIEFARNCGIPVCWAAYGFGNPEDCLALAPEYVIQTPLELLEVVNKWHNP